MNIKTNIKYGAYMGLGFCLYTTLMWLTNLDSIYLHIGQYFDIAIILLPLSIISLGIYQQNKLSPITLPQRIVVAISIGIVSFIIYHPFLYVYHNTINPEWFSAVINLKEIELNKANVNQDLIIEQLKGMRDSSIANAGVFELPAFLASGIILPLLISLISLIYIKKEK